MYANEDGVPRAHSCPAVLGSGCTSARRVQPRARSLPPRTPALTARPTSSPECHPVPPVRLPEQQQSQRPARDGRRTLCQPSPTESNDQCVPWRAPSNLASEEDDCRALGILRSSVPWARGRRRTLASHSVISARSQAASHPVPTPRRPGVAWPTPAGGYITCRQRGRTLMKLLSGLGGDVAATFTVQMESMASMTARIVGNHGPKQLRKLLKRC